MKNYLYLMLLLTLLSSCEKEIFVEVEVEKEHSWKVDSAFIFDKAIQLNSFATNEKLFLLGPRFFTSRVTLHVTQIDPFPIQTIFWYLHLQEPSIEKKMPIGPDFFASFKSDEKRVTFYPTASPTYNGLTFTMPSFDSDFVNFDFTHYSFGECIAINSLNQVLIPYAAKVGSSNQTKLLLLRIKSTANENPEFPSLSISTQQVLTFNDQFAHTTYGLYAVNDHFYITQYNSSYRINSDGEITSISVPWAMNMFEFEGTIYAIGYYNNKLYYSTDNGYTWTESIQLNTQFNLVLYTKIDNRMVAYYNHQLFEIIPSHTSITAVELDNDGLQGRKITSVSIFDGNVYVTTLSGVYRKKFEDFFKEKL
jgi:hypothetical protein